MDKPIFRDRRDAGRLLAQRLLPLKADDPVVIGLPRGGVPVAIEILAVLQGSLDLMVVRRITAPDRPGETIGAVVDNSELEIFLDEGAVAARQIRRDAIDTEILRARTAIAVQQRRYATGRPRPRLQNAVVILADDAVITGATMRVAARALYRERARRIVIAVPVAVAAAAETLQDECDQLVALHTVVDRDGLSRAYADFSPVTDSEVAHLVRALPTPFA